MYYHRLYKIWMLDPIDYFLISAAIGSFTASRLKKYLSEEKSMERLKKSIMKKSEFASRKPIRLTRREKKIKKIYTVALKLHGGDDFDFEAELNAFKIDHEFSNEVLQLAQQIKFIVERLLVYLKERELKGILKIFFKNGRVVLELLLYKCKIDLTYSLINDGISTQLIVITATTGGALGFTMSWFSVGTILVSPAVLILTLGLRGFAQQLLHNRHYNEFKNFFNKMASDPEVRETLLALINELDVPVVPRPGPGLEMRPFDSSRKMLPEFDPLSDQTLDEFIKERMKEQLGLIENPNDEQLQSIINRANENLKKRTTFLNDIIEERQNFVDAEIIDADIVQENIRVRNE